MKRKAYRSQDELGQRGAQYQSRGASHACQQRVSRSLALQHYEQHTGSPSTFGSEARETNKVHTYD